ncbi:hypothetical protein FG386_002308 [Cryptosporidium ryanae]|uniref:uncharacterized protein n=1 Tax=Cryptosporidium ryanae TaxID=515981 RepID=UPI00351A1673|nr:hypothetical protein FG386_002308 [Cryptosporidium ryanae]
MSQLRRESETCDGKLSSQDRSRMFSYLKVKIAVTVIASLILLVFYRSNGVSNLMEWASNSEKENAIAGLVVVILATSVLISVFVPLEPIVVSASYLLSKAYGNRFGVALSLVIAISSVEISSILTVYFIRAFVSEPVRDSIKRSSYFSSMNAVVGKRGALLVALVRLIPLIPFSATNYLLGIMDTSYPSILVGNLGSLPMSVFFVFLGLSASNLQFLESRVSKMSISPRYSIMVIGAVLAITILSTFALFSILVSEYRKTKDSDSHYVILDGERGQADPKPNDFRQIP